MAPTNTPEAGAENFTTPLGWSAHAAPQFVQSSLCAPEPAFDEIFNSWQEGQSCTVKDLADAMAASTWLRDGTTEKAAMMNQQGLGYAILPADGEPARVELPCLLGTDAPYSPESLAKATLWEYEAHLNHMTFFAGDQQAWPDDCTEDAGQAAFQCPLLPQCLAEDVYANMQGWGRNAEIGIPSSSSVGSASHGTGNCKPCAFANTKGCVDGVNCQFCHLCEAGEKKRRKKEKRQGKGQGRGKGIL